MYCHADGEGVACRRLHVFVDLRRCGTRVVAWLMAKEASLQVCNFAPSYAQPIQVTHGSRWSKQASGRVYCCDSSIHWMSATGRRCVDTISQWMLCLCRGQFGEGKARRLSSSAWRRWEKGREERKRS
ncbi:hypothetical protein VFPPC_16572 [Pochonia chlamydosporia 170]|uniref:Uncharacterized protein n=1 Tax=Pochonia chlamydosporia 170 TaxID=1380566 RepID=A0A179F8W2_METCM|nr:hypothetical protein VFPPC_16572 [Pochonia chlamydosporia 170]OAQ61872.1 hypothetical protein VFPPC_16572 [Pochonia chlamydosporia 170]